MEWLQWTGISILYSTLVCVSFEFPRKLITTESGLYKKTPKYILSYCVLLYFGGLTISANRTIHRWKKKWKIGVMMAYGNLGYYPLVAWILRIFPVLLEFIGKKMENRGKDWIWQVSRINSTCRMNFQNVPCFSIIHWKKWKIWVNLIRCGKSIWYILVGGWFIRIYSFSVVLIPCRKKKNGVVILSTCRMNCHNLPRVSRVDSGNGKLGWRLDSTC